MKACQKRFCVCLDIYEYFVTVTNGRNSCWLMIEQALRIIGHVQLFKQYFFFLSYLIYSNALFLVAYVIGTGTMP